MARKIGSLLLISSLAVILMLLIQQARQRTSAGRPTQEALTSRPDFVGWVLGVDPESGQIHVESQADKIVRPVTVKLTKDTMIFRRERGLLRQVIVE